MEVRINIAEAKAKLSELVARAEAGETVVLARAGKPVVTLTPVVKPATVLRTPGGWKHLGPLSQEEADAFFEPSDAFVETDDDFLS